MALFNESALAFAFASALGNSTLTRALAQSHARRNVSASVAVDKHGAVVYVYAILCFVSAVVNFTNLTVILSFRKLHTATNLFIANLAVSDLLTNVTIVLTPLYSARGEWAWGLHLCKTFFVISAISVLISSFTLAAIAVYRYKVICTSAKNGACRLKVVHAVLACGAIWVFAVAICAPLIANVKLYGRSRPQCIEIWTNQTHRKIFTWCLMLLQFALPVTLMAFCHVRIHVFLKEQLHKASITLRNMKQGRRLQTLKRRERIHRILFAMVVAYALCWLPLNIFNILYEAMKEQIRSWPYTMDLYFAVHILAMLSTVLDPLLYAVLNRQIRACILAAFKIGARDRVSDTPSV